MATATVPKFDEGTYVVIKNKPTTLPAAYAAYVFKGSMGKVVESAWSASHSDNLYTLSFKDHTGKTEYPIPFIPESCLEEISE